MNLNESLLLQLVRPYVKGTKITNDDFDRIFGKFPLSVENLNTLKAALHANGIELVDEHVSDEELVLDVDDTPAPADTFEDYDPDSPFKDKDIGREQTRKPSDLVVKKVIPQSNELLCALIQRGDPQAEQDLCVKNENLVFEEARKYQYRYHNRLDLEDLTQAGTMGLLKAAQKYRHDMGTKFSTYAVPWIRQYISREITDNGYAIRIPVHMVEHINKVAVVCNRLNGEGIELADQIPLVARELGYTEDLVIQCLVLKQNYLSYASLDTPIGTDQDTLLGELIPAEETATVESIAMSKVLRKVLGEVLATLSEREQEVLKLRIGWDNNEPKTLEEIGELYGVTRERIRQIENKALKKMRHPSRVKHFKDFREV